MPGGESGPMVYMKGKKIDMCIQIACENNGHFCDAMRNMLIASEIAMEPFTVYRPKLYPDGNQWCVLLGDNLQSGLCGFGDTPRLAVEDFNRNFNLQTLK